MISGYHSGDYERRFMRYGTVQTGRDLRRFE
jgi:hypothetical protein